LYKYCGQILNEHKLRSFLHCLRDSRNYAALQILEPNPELEVIPVPTELENFVNENSCITVHDIANILCERTPLSANWTLLRDVLEFGPVAWASISRRSNQQPLMDVIQLALEDWVSRNGMRTTVGLLCDSLSKHGHAMAAGSLIIYNTVFN
jgi:hypothetical protein